MFYKDLSGELCRVLFDIDFGYFNCLQIEMLLIFLSVFNSWFASCSDKLLRCWRGKTGRAGNILMLVYRLFDVCVMSFLRTIIVFTVSLQCGFQVSAAADSTAPAEWQRSTQRAAVPHTWPLHDWTGSCGLSRGTAPLVLKSFLEFGINNRKLVLLISCCDFLP